MAPRTRTGTHDDTGFDRPVVLILFNRPAVTRRILDAIAQVRPRHLLVIADGPRPGHPTDAERCRAARAVIDRVDWPCRVETNFAAANMGTRHRIASGLDWVFERVEEALVLEDDCLPDPTFFPFCAELLDRFRDDARVFAICGRSSMAAGRRNQPYSYYYSTLFASWGWATWRRAWRQFDMDMRLWPQMRREDRLMDLFNDRAAARFWTSTFDLLQADRLNSWAYRFQLACWAGNGLVVKPTRHLIRNIGFGEDATLTKDVIPGVNDQAGPVAFPLRHFPLMLPDRQSDLDDLRRRYFRPLHRRALFKLRRLARRLPLLPQRSLLPAAEG